MQEVSDEIVKDESDKIKKWLRVIAVTSGLALVGFYAFVNYIPPVIFAPLASITSALFGSALVGLVLDTKKIEVAVSRKNAADFWETFLDRKSMGMNALSPIHKNTLRTEATYSMIDAEPNAKKKFRDDYLNLIESCFKPIDYALNGTHVKSETINRILTWDEEKGAWEVNETADRVYVNNSNSPKNQRIGWTLTSDFITSDDTDKDWALSVIQTNEDISTTTGIFIKSAEDFPKNPLRAEVEGCQKIWSQYADQEIIIPPNSTVSQNYKRTYYIEKNDTALFSWLKPRKEIEISIHFDGRPVNVSPSITWCSHCNGAKICKTCTVLSKDSESFVKINSQNGRGAYARIKTTNWVGPNAAMKISWKVIE